MPWVRGLSRARTGGESGELVESVRCVQGCSGAVCAGVAAADGCRSGGGVGGVGLTVESTSPASNGIGAVADEGNEPGVTSSGQQTAFASSAGSGTGTGAWSSNQRPAKGSRDDLGRLPSDLKAPGGRGRPTDLVSLSRPLEGEGGPSSGQLQDTGGATGRTSSSRKLAENLAALGTCRGSGRRGIGGIDTPFSTGTMTTLPDSKGSAASFGGGDSVDT